MKDKVNSHFAVLLIVIAGAIAAWAIMRIADSDPFSTTVSGSEASYSSLKESILNQ